MNDEKKAWLAAVGMIAALLVAPAALSAAEIEDTPAAQAERRVVYKEGFEGDGRMAVWVGDGGYKVNFAGPTDERAATGKQSFKIDVTWEDDCTYIYWWAGGGIPLHGNPVVHGKLYVERGQAWLGHAYAVPEQGAKGHKVVGVDVRSLGNGWTEWRSSAIGTPGEAAYMQGVAVYIQPDKERRTVVYVDDLEVKAALPQGYRAELAAQIAEIEAARSARTQAHLQKTAAMLPVRFAKLAAEMDAVPAQFPAAASAELRDYWTRLCRHRDDLRSQLETQLAALQAKRTPPVAASARRLLLQLERVHPSCLSLAAYAAAHPALPYIVWITDPISNDNVLPERFPVPGIAGTELSASACAGEYEPVSFTIYAIEELRDVTVQCSAARSAESVLPASQIDVRIVKCWWQAGVDLDDVQHPTLTPELLLKDPQFVSVDNGKKSHTLKDPQAPRDAGELQPVSVPAAVAQQFWVTVRVPEDAKAGTYVATLTVRPQNAPEMIMPLRIKVLPFELEESALIYSIFYRGQLTTGQEGSIDTNWKSPQQYLAELRDLKAHGVTHPTMFQDFGNRQLFDRAMELRRQVGIVNDPLYAVGIGTRDAPTSAAALEALKKKVRAGLAQVREHGIKELYIVAKDEAEGEALKAERPAFKAVHEAGAKVFVACGAATFAVIGDLLDLAVSSGGEDPEKWHGVGHLIFSYANPQVGIEQPETYRRNYGLGLWKGGYDGAMDYAYQHAFGPSFYADDDANWRDYVFAYPTVDGVIDTIQWEGFREGVDDVRYLTTLLKEIERAKAADDKDALAKEAEEWVATMDPGGDLQALRAKMVEYITGLGN
ncbi:MAG: hypothetical protein QGF67_11610 [Lentisphaeria bacterium]|nr:hypothetical protein [Lentisphaeria bacterium]MDP7742082.1 hypothetical protein [Lentisphaeria bacterium]